jgi:hypothetical protein
VNIPNQELAICKLQIWKASDVSDWNSPDIDKVYRQWSVALSNTTSVNERANWLISGSDSYTGSGTLNITYPAIDEFGQAVIYQVDIYLNNKSGAKLASLQPGVASKKVSIDYGVHYLYYHYWYSNPNSTSGEIIDIGWDEAQDVVINAGHPEADITIPFYYSTIGKYGELTVYNETSKAITIYANDALIESIAKIDGSTQGLSVIPAMNSTTFVIPVNEYTITAKSVDGTSTLVSFLGVDILQDETAALHAGISYKSVSIKNSTNENLFLYTPQGEYMGQVIKPGQSTGTIKIADTITKLVVMNADQLKSKEFTPVMGVDITSLDERVSAKLAITGAWNVLSDNYYQSFAIGASETTSMTATLETPDSTTISFEYKVSSETGYDCFRFKIDGIVTLNNVSGEVGWSSYSTTVYAGTHQLEWIYSKDSMFNAGSDNVEIRNIEIN